MFRPEFAAGAFMHECHVKDCERGFSLPEMCIILAITAIMAAFSIPMVSSSMRDLQLISDARNIATTLTYAKLSAASQMTRYRLSFNTGNNEWSLSKLNRTSGNYEIQGPTNALRDGVADSGITLKSTSSSAPSGFPTTSSATITFNSRGIPIEGASVIYISNRNADYAVAVSLSGKVQFLRYTNSQWTSQ